MELLAPEFQRVVVEAIKQSALLLATVMLAPHPFADNLTVGGVAIGDHQDPGKGPGLIVKRRLGGGLENTLELVDAGQDSLRGCGRFSVAPLAP